MTNKESEILKKCDEIDSLIENEEDQTYAEYQIAKRIDDIRSILNDSDSVWFSVGGQNPSLYQHCLVYTKDRKMFVAVYSEIGFMTPCFCEEITHWTPLPMPPEG